MDWEWPILRYPRVRWGCKVALIYASPAGLIELGASLTGLRLIDFISDEEAVEYDFRARDDWEGAAPNSQPPSKYIVKYLNEGEPLARAILEQAVAELEEYFAGRRTRFDVPLDLAGTPFQQRVWQALLQIPYGTTMTYRELAAAIEKPAAIRAVGAANGANPLAVVVPCHRLVGSDGSLTGYAGGLPLKRRLIDFERQHAGEMGFGCCTGAQSGRERGGATGSRAP